MITAPSQGNSRVILESGRNRMVQGLYGCVLYNKHDKVVGKYIEEYGEYFESEVAIFRQVCRPGDVVMDVGANIGTHALALAHLVGPAGRVFAFEPQRVLHQLLCANAALNSLDQIECIRAAVSDRPSTISLGDPDYDTPNNFGGIPLAALPGVNKTPVVTLDEYLEVPGLRLLKIDVEGMELEVLRGAQRIIQAYKPMIYLENDRPANSTALLNYLDSIGYHSYWHLPPDYRPDNFFNNPCRLFNQEFIDAGGEFLSSIGFAINLFCVPAMGGSQINGFRRVTNTDEHPLKRKYSSLFTQSSV